MDRRTEKRVNWNDSIQYRNLDAGAYKTGNVRNISVNGALLWLKENLSVGSSFELLTESNGNQEHVYMHVVRTEETDHEGYKGYGCRVEMRISEAA